MEKCKKHLVLIGAGKIGCGYLADLFGNAGYSLTFLVHSPVQTQKMRDQGYYTLFVTGEQSGETVKQKVSGYEAFCTATEREQCVDALCNTNYASLHTYPGAFPELAELLADAVKKRCALGLEDTLDVLLCVNVIDAFEQFDSRIRAELSAQEQAYYEKYVGLVRTLTYRGGFIPKPEQLAEDELAVWASDYPDLPVDKEGFKGEVPEGVNLRLMDKMVGRAVAKVWCGNVRSCSLAMLSAKWGFTYTNEGAGVAYIRKCVDSCQEEATQAVLLEYGFAREDLALGARAQKGEDWWSRMLHDGMPDAIFRVANDPIRKLSRKDRLTGPALCCLKHGILPYFLTRAIAYAFFYRHPDDAASMEIAACIEKEGIDAAIEKYCQLDLENQQEKLLLQMVRGHYYEILDWDPMDFEPKPV